MSINLNISLHCAFWSSPPAKFYQLDQTWPPGSPLSTVATIPTLCHSLPSRRYLHPCCSGCSKPSSTSSLLPLTLFQVSLSSYSTLDEDDIPNEVLSEKRHSFPRAQDSVDEEFHENLVYGGIFKKYSASQQSLEAVSVDQTQNP